MTDTPRLGITQLEEDQALPEAVVNEGTRILEAFANATHFKSRTTTAQPGSPTDGDVYLLPGSSTGADWAGHDGEIAIFLNTAWVFKDAKEGFLAWIDDDDEFLIFDGTDWIDPLPSSGAIEVLDEGASETASLVSLDFVGAGVSASDDGSGNVTVTVSGGGGSAPATAVYEDQKAANTAGGASTSGSWIARTLNTEVYDDIGITLASNQLSIPAGTYEFDAACCIYGSDRGRCRLQDVTNTATLGLSESINGPNAAGVTTAWPRCVGKFTVAGTTLLELQYRVQTSRASNGLGVETNFGVVEIYSRVKLTKTA